MSQQPSFGVNYAHGVRQRTPPGPHGLSGVSSSPSSSQQQQLQAISPMYRGHQTPTPSKMGPGPLQGPRHPQPFPPAGYGPQTSSPGFQHEQYGAQPRLVSRVQMVCPWHARALLLATGRLVPARLLPPDVAPRHVFPSKGSFV